MITSRTLDIPLSAEILDVLRALRRRGYQPFVVGGAVRDALLRVPSPDFDIEVYSAGVDELVGALEEWGQVDAVGRSFGVLKFSGRRGSRADFALPRRDSKVEPGHKGFVITTDRTLTPAEAAARRDFTVNAMMYDPLAEELHDYYGGEQDLRAGILRATSGAFSEDPLRVLRGMQFACRFNLALDPETASACQAVRGEFSHLARERIADEFMKYATKASHPGRIFEYLRASGWIDLFPELAVLRDVPQEPEWHPEGDVEVHTALVLDQAAQIANREKLQGDDRAVLILGALCHDFGKAVTTERREKRGVLRITAHDHERQGVPLAERFLQAIGIKRALIERILPLVERHLDHMRLRAQPPVPFVRRLASELSPATIRELVYVIEADHSGRPPLPGGLPAEAEDLLRHAELEGVASAPPNPLLQGRDVIPFYGNQGGLRIGEILKDCYAQQLAGRISTHDEAVAWLLTRIRPEVSFLRGEDVLPYFERPGPWVRAVLDKAWALQTAKVFQSREEACAWLPGYLSTEADASWPIVPR